MKCFPFLQGLFQLAGAVHGPLEFSIAKREAVQLPVDKLHQFLILTPIFWVKVAGPWKEIVYPKLVQQIFKVILDQQKHNLTINTLWKKWIPLRCGFTWRELGTNMPIVLKKFKKETSIVYRRTYQNNHAVDGWNPAPPRMMIIPLLIGF